MINVINASIRNTHMTSHKEFRQQHVEDQVDQVHQAHLITAPKDNVHTPIRVNKTHRRRLSENRHMSMRIVASVQLKYKTSPSELGKDCEEQTAKQGTL